MATNFRAIFTVDHNNNFFRVDASYQCRNVAATRLDDADSGAEISEVHSVDAWTFDAQGNKIGFPTDNEVPQSIEDRLCDLAFDGWCAESEPDPDDYGVTDPESDFYDPTDPRNAAQPGQDRRHQTIHEYGRDEAKERVALKRELRRLGVPFDCEAPTQALQALKRLAVLETLVGDIFDGCVNPLTAASMKIENMLHHGSWQPKTFEENELMKLHDLVAKALTKFCEYRATYEASRPKS